MGVRREVHETLEDEMTDGPEAFQSGDVAVLRGNLSREDWEPRLLARLRRHVGRRCVVLGEEVDGYWNVAFTSGFKVSAISGHHLERPRETKRFGELLEKGER